MMATAPSVDDLADVSASPKTQPSSSVHDVDSGSPALNGNTSHDEIENKHITNVEDQLNSTDASASGGSDTEGKLKDGDKSHARTSSSVKKPATFKAVSVNKTFLASKAATPTSTSKVSDKSKSGSSTPPPGSATPSASRPRLVAKTGSGTRDSGPRSSGVNGGKPASAPDPNAVWNKNRPTPTPDPKKLTDEELKKYGIHVASRLDEDDAQGQNKWADLDDDDDDWAPEAITWTDGTKTTLPHTDEPQIHPQADDVVAENGQLQGQAQPPAPPLSTIQPHAKPAGLATGKGLVLKGAAPERPTLVAKPPAPQQPAKSPWATLPPVEKASPAASEPPTLSSRGFVKEPLPPRGMGAPGPPLREIAADDFSRSTWRDGASHGNRELYNSQSGRYEPVLDRRGSLRSDQAKHPSVLQRPIPGDQPAEPSSAFQTHRTSQDGHFGRRRGSSNVSGGSGSFFQRSSKGSDGHMPPPEILTARRPSQAGSMESPISPVAIPGSGPNQGKYQQHPQPGYTQRPSPGATFATMHQPGPAGVNVAPLHPPAPQMIDDVEYQKRLMREKTELARKRRQEQEAAEEAARRERIQKKLDAMGPPPKKKSDKPDASPAEEPDNRLVATLKLRIHKELVDQATALSRTMRLASPLQRVLDASRMAKSRGNPHGLDPALIASFLGPLGPNLRETWRIPGSSVAEAPPAKGPPPIAPPGASREPREPSQVRQHQPPAPIGSRPSRYGQPASDVTNKWVNSVAENDKKMGAARLAERAERERQLAEREMALEDAQPSIKDTWRPVSVAGDGTRRPMAPADSQTSQSGRPWQGSGEELSRTTPPREGPAPSPHAGVIGSGSSSVLSQGGQGASSQGRTSSRFFPVKDVRGDGLSGPRSRAQSPTPPPPTMEGHPAYEGNTGHPHVSLPKPPKPQPIVKLPPAMSASHSQPESIKRAPFAWASPTPYKDAARAQPAHHQSRRSDETSQQDWQRKFNNLLNNGKHSPPKSMGVDPASKNALDYHVHEDSATVSLPGRSPAVAPAVVVKTTISKPMAEECFDEPEIGSLPHVKLPHKFPDAAWQPAEAPNKPLPRRFVVQPSVMEPFYFAAEAVSGGNAMRIHFPGMPVAKSVTVPFVAGRGGRGGHSKPSRGNRGSHRSNSRRDASGSHETSGQTNGQGSRGGRGRGGYRSRGSENWSRQSPAQSSQA
ncbi:hypothetical protein ACO1O0_004631 [Amphichorda felina]